MSETDQRSIVSKHDEKKLLSLIAKPNFKSSYRFKDSNLIPVKMGKSTVTLNKHIYLGQAVLDIFKTLMNEPL